VLLLALLQLLLVLQELLLLLLQEQLLLGQRSRRLVRCALLCAAALEHGAQQLHLHVQAASQGAQAQGLAAQALWGARVRQRHGSWRGGREGVHVLRVGRVGSGRGGVWRRPGGAAAPAARSQ
jgi:hypothetical protein